ncbi:ATP-binding cassette domain-containing protein [uncultured Akkermansia sp.]|uniref:ATP-binding cassette domain-containing protein n=1 Tax=uncultured Akkermansia sp. TaxID=512294 RepID=UPI0026DD8D72|nr:ATP-binding cassette domain-containing protein [uncultured Akkermansia sp.]
MKLVCEDVCFGYAKKSLIFENYSHAFHSGITILKGYSGCGKTTLLKILAGYLRIQSGHILTPHGIPLSNTKYRRKEVSYMFQGINLLPLATVERNLQLCAEMAMLPRREWQARASSLIEQLGLDNLRHKKAGTLSGGQAQRAALARTLMKDSSILLLDEPTSGLDDTNTGIIKNLIATQTVDKICIVSTHDARLLDIAHEIIDFNAPVSL